MQLYILLLIWKIHGDKYITKNMYNLSWFLFDDNEIIIASSLKKKGLFQCCV